MSQSEPDGPYIYQPYGMQHREHWKAGRIYGIAGIDALTRIDGLTKDEATLILAIYRAHFINRDPERNDEVEESQP